MICCSLVRSDFCEFILRPVWSSLKLSFLDCLPWFKGFVRSLAVVNRTFFILFTAQLHYQNLALVQLLTIPRCCCPFPVF